MKKNFTLGLFLTVFFLFISVSSVKAQYAYGLSALAYDPTTREVLGVSKTWLDYEAGRWYHPYVEGRLYQVNQQVDSGWSLGSGAYIAARVDTDVISTPSTLYTLRSDHWVRRGWFVTVGVVDYWYDPWGYRFFSGGYGNSFPGSWSPLYIVPLWTFLGYTQVSGYTPPLDTCEYAPPPPEEGIIKFENEPSAVPCPSPTPSPQINAEVTSVGFTGDHEIYKWPANNDYQSAQPITDPTWVRGSNDNKPVAYTKGTGATAAKLLATLTLTPAIPAGQSVSAQIRVKKGTEIIATKTGITLTGDTAQISDIQANNKLEDTTPIVAMKDYNFAWEISFDNGVSWRSIGNSGPHKVYWLYGNPQPDKFVNRAEINNDDRLYDLALSKSIGRLNETGVPNTTDLAEKISFLVDRDFMYNPEQSIVNGFHALSVYQLTSNGDCGFHANLLRSLLRSIGYPAETSYYWGGKPSTNPNNFNGKQFFYIHRLSSSPGDTEESTFQIERERHDLAKENPHYQYHAMVKISDSSNIYDPSYGKVFSSQNAGLKFLEVADGNSSTRKFEYNENATPFKVEWKKYKDIFNVAPYAVHTGWLCDHVGQANRPATTINTFDNDTRTDIAVWRSSDGVWYIQNSSDDSFTGYSFGTNGDLIAPADYDGDGKTDPAIFRPSSGDWWILQSSDSSTRTQQFGLSGDKPVPGDYDGDGKADLAVFRPSSGVWYITQSSDNSLRVQQFGLSSDIPVPGDYDGDGKIDLAVWHPSDGVWHIMQSGNSTYVATQYGSPSLGAKPVPGDYDNDGRTDVAIWHSVDGNWWISYSSGGSLTENFGNQSLGDIPVPSDFDSDGKTDIAVWRPSEGTWHIINSSNWSTQTIQWGLSSDVPIPGAIYR